jgi:allantoin racemase
VARTSGISESFISSIRAINVSIAEMAKSPDETLLRLEAVSNKALEEDGAQAIVLGCTEMGRDIQSMLSDRIGVPVVDPNVATVGMALALVGARLTQSPRGFPPRKQTLEERYVDQRGQFANKPKEV